MVMQNEHVPFKGRMNASGRYLGHEGLYPERASVGALFGRFEKRALDVVVSFIAILLLLPLFVVVAALIKLDSRGPVIFFQSRRGLHGTPFMIAKFRTMSSMDNGATIRQATRDDARVTRVGKWLRKTSIDELPQLFNVLAGQMSLVGPRPHAVAHDVKYSALISSYNQRSDVKPGITGWAQINHCRGETRTVQDMEARVEKDLWYIEHWSVGLDLRIMLGTFRTVMTFEDAY